MDALPNTIEGFLREDGAERSLVVANRTRTDAVMDLFESAFGDRVDVHDRAIPEADEDAVLLFEDGEVVATSSLDAVLDSYLLVNGDAYRTGTNGVDEYTAPAVLTELAGTTFRLRGFPASNKEKLLLILVSRYIEKLALDAGAGRLRASFQRLSRLDDERGTREVYERLGETDVETHVYGVPDWEPPDSMELSVHGGRTEEHRDSWFVVFTGPDGRGRDAAMVSVERAPNEWMGTWTFDPDRVARVDRYVARAL